MNSLIKIFRQSSRTITHYNEGAILTSMIAQRNFSNKHSTARKQEIIELTETIVSSIRTGDYDTYCKWVDPQLTCFEPVAYSNLVEGLEFHKFYFDNVLGKNKAINTTICNPTVHLLGDDAACIAYVRLTQFMDKTGTAQTKQSEETRVWQRKDGRWLNIHLHTSF